MKLANQIINTLSILELPKESLVITNDSALVLHGIIESVENVSIVCNQECADIIDSYKNKPILDEIANSVEYTVVNDLPKNNKIVRNGYMTLSIDNILDYYRDNDEIIYHKIIEKLLKDEDTMDNLFTYVDDLENRLSNENLNDTDKFIIENELILTRNKINNIIRK